MSKHTIGAFSEIESFDEPDKDDEHWADSKEGTIVDIENDDERAIILSKIHYEIDGEDDVHRMVLSKMINRFGKMVTKFKYTEPNYSLKVIQQMSKTYYSHVELEYYKCYETPSVLTSLFSAIGAYKRESANVTDPYFELNVKQNSIPKSRETRRLYSRVIVPAATVVRVSTRVTYRELIKESGISIVALIRKFKNVDKEEYDYWVSAMCESLE